MAEGSRVTGQVSPRLAAALASQDEAARAPVDWAEAFAGAEAAWLKGQAAELGFDDCGIASADDGTPTVRHLDAAMDAGHLAPLDYMANTHAVRRDIQAYMPGTRRVVMFAVNYHTGHHADFVPLEALTSRAKVSRYAWGGDYHNHLKRRLRKLQKRILARHPDAVLRTFVDTAPVLERAWAQKAGLGFVGKSALFIHRGFGTWTFLCGIAINLPFAVDAPIEGHLCGRCTRCLDACPTSAIVAPHTVDANRCVTTWNVERPLDAGAASPAQVGHGWVVGCDICQEVCPWNKFENPTADARFMPRDGHAAFGPDDMPTELAGTAFARPGPEGLRASLDRALGPKADTP